MTEGVKSFRLNRKSEETHPFEVTYEKKVVDGNGELVDPVRWEEVTERFSARPYIAGGHLLDVTASFAGGGAIAAARLLEFFDEALVDEDRLRFARLIRDPDIAVDLAELAQITDWLMEQYGNRPTRSA